MTILVTNARPRSPELAAVKYRVRVQAAVLGGAIDLVGHLEGWKFRRQVMHVIDWPEPGGGLTIRSEEPPPGPVEHWIPWVSAPRAEHVGIVLGAMSFASSTDPYVRAELYDFSVPAAPVALDGFGCEWRASAGTLRNDRLDNGGGYIYPLRYLSTSARAVAAAAVGAVTRPRVLNVPPTATGNPLAVRLVAEHVRVLSVTVFERPETTVG